MGLLIENCKLGGVRLGSVRVEGRRVVRVTGDTTQDVPEGTQKLDANGATLLPGFTDSHCHPFEYGWLKRSVDLRGTSNITGLRLRLLARVQRSKPGEWLTGMGWDQEAFPDGKMPGRSDVDDLSPDNPVALSRICGHVVLLNTVAIETLSLEAKQGYEYERDQAGRLTGIVKETAMEEVYAKIPRSPQTCAQDLLSVEVEAARHGLTTLHCIVSPDGYAEELEAIAALHAAGALSLRYRLYIPPDAIAYVEAKGFRQKLNDDVARINGVKIYADGSLGARTAALREPYADEPGNSGNLRHTDERLAQLVDGADAAGYQVIVHAIGDRAIEQAVRALSLVTGARNPRRHRVEHASLLSADLRTGMAKHGIRAAVQPLFITSDTWAAKRLGEERVNDLYPLKSMLTQGIVASGSSDAPVESMSPIVAIWAAIVRGGYAPRECLTFDQAVGLYTANAGANGFDEESSAPVEGGGANFTVLDSDIRGMHPAILRKVEVAATVIGGEIVYSSLGLAAPS